MDSTSVANNPASASRATETRTVLESTKRPRAESLSDSERRVHKNPPTTSLSNNDGPLSALAGTMSNKPEPSTAVEQPTSSVPMAIDRFGSGEKGLPNEILEMIFCMSSPKLVRLIATQDANGVITIGSNVRRPEIFYANKRLAEMFLTRFTLRFRPGVLGTGIHFNFGVDTLYLGRRCIPPPLPDVIQILQLALPEDISRVDLLAVNDDNLPQNEGFEEEARDILSCFLGNVKQFTVVHSEVYVPTRDKPPNHPNGNCCLSLREPIALVDVMHVTERLRFSQMLIQDCNRLNKVFGPENQPIPHFVLPDRSLYYKGSKRRFRQTIEEDLGLNFQIPEYKQKLVTSVRVAEDLEYQMDACKNMGLYIHKEWTCPWCNDDELYDTDDESRYDWDPSYGVEDEDIYTLN